MEISFTDSLVPVPEDWNTAKSLIKVIGVGGGGCNAVTEMFRQKIHDVEFVICNTDKQSMNISDIPEKIHIGSKGLGAGCNPENGRRAAIEHLDKIKKVLSDSSEMVFITAGMGGGTGTGAAPIIAQTAKELGKLTVGVVTLPFRDEGKEFVKRAVLGIRELKKHVDSLLIIDNQKLYDIYGDLNIYEAFPRADAVLSNAVKSIAEIITRPGFINVDFADVKMVMKNSGMAIMGTGIANGPDRASKAVEMAFESPLLNDCDLRTAKGVLVNITSSKDQGPTMAELKQIMDYVNNYTGHATNFKRGIVVDDSMADNISVTIVATGFEILSLPDVGLDEEEANDNGKIILGQSGLYGSSQDIDTPVRKVEIEGTPYITDSESEDQESNMFAGQPYVRQPGKPALILEQGDDITKFETVPAYLRRNKKLQDQLVAEQEMPQEQAAGTMKLNEVDGSHHLSSNSYLHQTQD